MQFIMWFSGETDVMWGVVGGRGTCPDINITHSLVSRSHSYQMLPASGSRAKSLSYSMTSERNVPITHSVSV